MLLGERCAAVDPAARLLMDDVDATSRQSTVRPLSGVAMARVPRLSLLLLVLLCTAGVCTASQEEEEEVADAVEEVAEEATQAVFAHLVFSKVRVSPSHDAAGALLHAVCDGAVTLGLAPALPSPHPLLQ
jgi:hypothetical protein